MEEKVINDVTCTNSVEFNCKRDKSTKNDGYGPKGVVCSRKPTQACYNIPRKIQVEVCKTDVNRYCEKFSNIFPTVSCTWARRSSRPRCRAVPASCPRPLKPPSHHGKAIRNESLLEHLLDGGVNVHGSGGHGSRRYIISLNIRHDEFLDAFWSLVEVNQAVISL